MASNKKLLTAALNEDALGRFGFFAALEPFLRKVLNMGSGVPPGPGGPGGPPPPGVSPNA